jgi:hypothetical protein
MLLVVLPKDFWKGQKKEAAQSRVLIPEFSNEHTTETVETEVERMNYASGVLPVVKLEDGEVQIAVIAEDFDGDGAEEQVIAYRNLMEKDNLIYITFVDYDEEHHKYRRVWNASTAAVRHATASLFSIDLIGNHRNCVAVTGMNQNDEQTLTAFSIVPANEQREGYPSYKQIIRLVMDGTIVINEIERSQAYQMGFANGASWQISSRGHDPYSANSFDQIEESWRYDPIAAVYRKESSVRIPGAKIEETRLRELLSGGKQGFEQFVDGLWYHITDEGAIDNERYIYFDTAKREVSFYNDDTQQVFRWQSSYATKYGLFISSQNISVATLNRKIDIELKSLDSISVRVSEDVRMRIIMNAPWDGSYRKAQTLRNTGKDAISVSPGIDAEYNSAIGRVFFYQDGSYEIELNGSLNKGKYAFYKIGGYELLEFIPSKDLKLPKQTYRVKRQNGTNELSLARVRLGINGLYEFREAPITLN